MHNILVKTCTALLLFTTIHLVSCSSGGENRRAETESREMTMQELVYGKLLAKKILSTYPLYKNEEATLYLNKVGKSIALFAGRPELTYHFAILNSDSINAFAAPGGYIFITKGSLKIMESEAELAAVIAHEIGHVNNRHIMKQIPLPKTKGIVDSFAGLLVAQGTVVSSAINETVNKASNLLFEEGYLVDDEFEADRSAIDYLVETGYNQTALITFMQKLDSKSGGDLKVYHTHPPTATRIENVNQYITMQELSSIEGKDIILRFQNIKRSID